MIKCPPPLPPTHKFDETHGQQKAYKQTDFKPEQTGFN